MRLTTNVTLSLLLLAVITLAGCDKSTPTYPGATKTTDDKSSVAHAEDSSVPVAISDANISNDVKTALLMDEDLKNFDISVVSTKGDVRLSGQLANADQISQAVRVAKGVVGVKAVHDELTLRP